MFGHDTELFAMNSDGSLASVIGLIGGTKDDPRIVPDGTLQEDNISAEFAVNCTDDIDLLWNRTVSVRQQLEEIAEEHGLRLVAVPSVECPPEVAKEWGPAALESGCDPDLNIYTGENNTYPDPSETSYRGGSGHIHMDCNPAAAEIIVPALDYCIKLPLIAKFGGSVRDLYHGCPGNYRIKPYGIEYRSPDNRIVDDEDLFKEVIARARRVIRGEFWGQQHTHGIALAGLDGRVPEEFIRDLVSSEGLEL